MQTNPKSNKMRTKSSLPNLSSPVTLTALCRRVPYPRTVLVLTWKGFKFWKNIVLPSPNLLARSWVTFETLLLCPPRCWSPSLQTTCPVLQRQVFRWTLPKCSASPPNPSLLTQALLGLQSVPHTQHSDQPFQRKHFIANLKFKSPTFIYLNSTFMTLTLYLKALIIHEYYSYSPFKWQIKNASFHHFYPNSNRTRTKWAFFSTRASCNRVP